MLYKKLRVEKFYKGDLVKPDWKNSQPMGLGIIIDIERHRWTGTQLTVLWQLCGIIRESPMDLQLVQETLD